MLEYPIARAYADARVNRIYGGSNEIMLEIVGRSLGLGEPRYVNLELAGRRAIVTGGSRGIGLAVARGLALEGAPSRWWRAARPLEEAARALSGVAVAADAGPTRRSPRGPHVIAVPADTGSDDCASRRWSRGRRRVRRRRHPRQRRGHPEPRAGSARRRSRSRSTSRSAATCAARGRSRR